MSLRVGTVFADHSQFTVGAIDADTLEITAEGKLLETGPGFLTVITGVAYGPVNLVLELLDTAPSTDDDHAWEMIEETTIESRSELHVMRLDGERAQQFSPLPPGTYGVRASARGRDRQRGMEVSEPTEDHRLRLWASTTSPSPPPITAVKLDKVATGPVNPAPPLDESYVCVHASDGTIVKVGVHSPEAEATRALTRDWGGRPPSPALAQLIPAYYISGFDRDILDLIEALDPQRQRAFAYWCAHRAIEHAGLLALDWAQQGLAALGTERTPPPELEHYSAAIHRIEHDRRVPLTTVSGVPGSTELIQQYQAFLTYFEARDRPDPLHAAVAAYQKAAHTFGMGYRELAAAARRDFFAIP
ncbi:hypothetical protein [Nocardia sp. XZ_19_385]|uniref:hypothetical protein n=1 Tax=Nocardia sp. XZ_19_385 TaxID=2769488 RepID=UPI0018907433|nr:hypothetical protein [Nocardia sp. XZ_19_385]